MIRARIIAAGVEALLCVAVACPAYFLSSQAGLGATVNVGLWLAIGFALGPLTLSIRAITQGHPAPEHRRHGLLLSGSGCNLCRLIRFWWPLALAPAALACAGHSGLWGIAALGTAATAIHLATGLSALAEGREPHWARSTGFQFAPAAQ